MTRRSDRRRFLMTAAAAGTTMAGRAARAAVGGRPTDLETLFRQRWDYVIVGGGSAGCVLARRLSTDPGLRVLLIEAGGVVDDPAVDAPQAWPGLAGGAYDWNYQSTPQPGLSGRSLPQPRGRGLGGSTLINALGLQRGPHEAYDRWARETGDAGWGFQRLLPYFRRFERASGGAREHRGGEGPLHVLEVGGAPDRNPLSVAFIDAAVAAGHPFNPDWNGARADGASWNQLTIRDGRRDTAASAFVDPVSSRPNLGVATGAQVLGLDIDRGRCRGVRILADGVRHAVSADRETILSAGAFGSPRLLMLSGVGDAAALRRIGIASRHDLPGVGRNLHDHPLVPGLLYEARREVPASRYNHGEAMVVARSRRSPGWADLQLMGLSVPFLSPELGSAPPQSFSIVPALMHPRSRGSLSLASADPAVPPRIDPGYLLDAHDVEALVDAVEIAREVAAARPLQAWIARERFPGPAVTRRTALAAHVRRVVSPFFHPVSTCRMGRADDPEATVDPECRVRGLAGLRVVDASVFPSIPQAMTNAAVLALAERASDLILARPGA